MSEIQSGFELSSTNLTPEYAKTQNSENNVSLAKGIGNNITQGKNVTEQEAVDKVDDKQPLTLEQLEKVAQQLQYFIGEMNRCL